MNRRRFYAEEIQAVANLRSRALVDALATVERERFLPPGPWMLRSEGDFGAAPRLTPDGSPDHVYHNVAIAIDSSRMLFNGAPSVVAGAIDALMPAPGNRVLHVGTGPGYYTALLAHCVGASGRVLGIEADEELASRASENLARSPWVQVIHGDASGPMGESFDAILINAGVTHPLPSWLDALAPNGRMMVPITATIGPVTSIGKGLMLLVTATADRLRFNACPAGLVAIYSAVGVRDDDMNAKIGGALSRSPFVRIRSIRRDAHAPDDNCWVHGSCACFSLE